MATEFEHALIQETDLIIQELGAADVFEALEKVKNDN